MPVLASSLPRLERPRQIVLFQTIYYGTVRRLWWRSGGPRHAAPHRALTRHRRRESTADELAQGPQEGLPVAGWKGGEHVVVDAGDDVVGLDEHLVAASRDVDDPHAPVPDGRPTLDETGLLKLVDGD